MTVLTDRLAYPNVKTIVLAELTAGEWLRFWTAAGGGYTNTYYAPTIAQASRTVSAVKENGTSLTERASIALVDANAGSWYWDRTNARVYVHPTGSVSPYTKTIQGTLKFYFSNVSRIYNGIYYDGRISSLPSLSMRVEANFGDVGQLGGGNLGLRNEDEFFDSLTDLNWNAGQCGLLLGADDPLVTPRVSVSVPSGFYGDSGSDGFFSDTPDDGFSAEAPTLEPSHAQCAYADFEAVGTWKVSGWDRADDEFILQLEEKKNALKIKIPTTLYDKATYPNLRDSDVGKVIPYGWGKIYDIEPACVDVTTRQFKVAGHAIKQFTGVRVRDESTNAWVNKDFASRDTATATFTLAAVDWDGSAAVAVDFWGRVRVDGYLMDNASDVIKDIATTLCGEAAGTIHASSFSDSYDALLIGTDADGNPVSSRAVSLYLNEEKEAAEIISQINACVGSYLFSDFDGKYRYVVFDPIPGDSAPLFEDSDIGLFEGPLNVAEEIVSSVKVEYQYRKQSDYSQIATDDRAEIQYLQGAAGPALKVMEKQPLSEYRDALNIASRTLAMDGAKRRTFRAKLNHRAWTLLPTGYVRVVYAARGIDDVFEILEVKKNLESMTWIDVVLGDLHGIGARFLFLTADSPTFPASLGGGACDTWDDNWTDAQKAWARQNVGYISDDYDFVSATDADSFRVGVIAA